MFSSIDILFNVVQIYLESFITWRCTVNDPEFMEPNLIVEVCSNDAGASTKINLMHKKGFFNYKGSKQFINDYLPDIVNAQLKNIFNTINITIHEC